MGKFTKKLIAILLCVAMIGTWLPMGVYAVEDETTYTLYPTPHSIAYHEGSFELKDINVRYGTGVDDATKTRLAETAALRSLSVTEAGAADSEKTNVYVAVYGSGDEVESHILANYTVDAALFEKTDANFVAMNNGEIVVLGKDTDACFYGLTTLYQIFGQLTANTLRNLTISDYADVVSRGFIEGYYGNPWSTEDRINLMKWGGYYKLNAYFYAPKDDPKHNSNWRALYTDEELETLIKPLAEAGNASKCRFVYALHPYMYNAISYASDEAYQADLAVMQAKFAQVIEAGVRQIAILADDASNVGSANYIKTLEDMTAWLEEMKETYPDLKTTLIFVTQEYMYNGESYYASFPENVQIVMTGGRVWGEVSNEYVTTFYNNVGRGPFLWINWPCTDNSKKHLIMGGYTTFLHPGVDPSKIEGIVLNPMQQSEPSKVAIFGNACYSWNIWETEEEANAAYDVSFAAVDHNTVVPNDASNALKELSKHMINQNLDSRVTALQESVDLKDELNAFKTKLSAGTYTQAEIDSLVEEFTILKNAAITYRAEGNEAIAGQIVYWLDCWDDTTAAVISYLNALSALRSDADDAVVWDHYANGQAAFESSTNHPLWYMDHYEYAEVGVQHIVPFMNALGQDLSAKVAVIVDPTIQIATYLTNRTDSPATGSVANVTDGNDGTSAIYKTPNAIVTGDYVGLMFNQLTDIRNIHIVLGAGKDHFDQGKLEYTVDGTTWQALTLTGMENSFTGVQNVAQVVDVAEENLPEGFQALGIRFIATADNAADAWLEVREVAVNVERAESVSLTAFEGNAPSYYSGSLTNMVDGDASTFGWYADYGSVGQYVGVDLGSVVKVGKVTFTQDSGDHFSNYTLQYSTDGTTYTDYATYSDAVLSADLSADGIEARYIRFYNNATTSCWIKIYEIAVEAASETTVMTNSAALASWKSHIVADSASLQTTGDLTLAPDEYIGYDLGRIKDLVSIAVDAQGTLTLQVSPNMVDWITVTAGEISEDARYVRLVNLTDGDVTTTLNTFTVTSNEYSGPYLYETTMDINSSWGVAEDCRNNGAAFDGDVSTITEFGDLPQQGQYIIYDLGREREISKLEIYCADSAVNYIRDAQMQISDDLTTWTTVLTIGDGVQNTDDANVTCINSDAGYAQATSTYPNYVSIEGTVAAQTARYIRILMTATNNNRAVVFNEIEINNGEYISVSNDPTFVATATEVQGYVPQNMIDRDLTTSWKPDTTEAGSVIYTFSDNLEANRINIVQKTTSNARVSIYAENDGERAWIDMGTLDKSLVKLECDNDLNLALKIEWAADAAPNITEIVRYSVAVEEEPETGCTYVNGFCTNGECAECGGYESAVDSDGDGVYEIDNAGKLYWFAQQVNGGEAALNAILTADIVVNEGTMTAESTDVRDWTPIGWYTSSSEYLRYAGTFDGDGHSISGLYCADTTASYVGLVGYLETTGAVKNVTVTDSYISGKANVGGIVGYSYGGPVTNCHYSGTVTSASGGIGGIAGYCRTGTVIANCTTTGTVAGGGSNTGGIAGYCGGSISGCTNSATVTCTTSTVGGIVGWLYNGTVENCTNTGDVSSTATTSNAVAGGIIGNLTGTVSGCTNSGNVTGTATLGGIVGQLSKGSAVSDCSNSGTITGTSTTKGQVGGVVGYAYGQSSGSVTITKCCNTGNVSSGYQYTGGIAGQANYSTVDNCCNTGNITGGSTYVGGVVGGFSSSNNTLSNSYSTGTVTGSKSYVGAVIGSKQGTGTITNCYYLPGTATDVTGTVQNGTGNGTQGSVTADIEGATTSKTAAQFASGEVAYLLNGSTSEGDLVWFQTIGTDAAPKFEGGTVYYNGSTYSNEPAPGCAHTAGEAVRENETAATCEQDGSYDSVVYCTACGEEVSRETVTVPATGHSYEDGICTVCGAAAGVAYNIDTDTAYATVTEALDAAQAGQTVVLLTNVTETTILVVPGVTLDLKGFELNASYAVAFNTSHIVDSVGTGRLVTGIENLVLDEENAMIPVYDGQGYVFTKAGFAIRRDTAYTGEGIKINALACPVNMDIVEMLKDGGADNNIRIVIRLSWDTTDGVGYQEFAFTDEVMGAVYNSNQGTWNSYSQMFSMVITGFEEIENLNARVLVISGTNAEYISTQSLSIT